MRVQFPTTVTADSQQGDVFRVLPVKLLPGAFDQLIHEAGTACDQWADLGAGAIQPIQFLLGIVQCVFENCDGRLTISKALFNAGRVPQLKFGGIDCCVGRRRREAGRGGSAHALVPVRKFRKILRGAWSALHSHLTLLPEYVPTVRTSVGPWWSLSSRQLSITWYGERPG